MHVERCLWHSSSSQWSRPERISVGASVRRATSTVSTALIPSMARSTVFLRGILLPPRRPSLAVTTTRHPASTIRSRRASALKPPKTTECTAPMRAQASMV